MAKECLTDYGLSYLGIQKLRENSKFGLLGDSIKVVPK